MLNGQPESLPPPLFGVPNGVFEPFPPELGEDGILLPEDVSLGFGIELDVSVASDFEDLPVVVEVVVDVDVGVNVDVPGFGVEVDVALVDV